MKQNVAAILLAIVGIVFGVIGIVTGISAKNQQSEVLVSVSNLQEKLDASVAAMDQDVKSVWNGCKSDIAGINSDLASIHQALTDMTNKPVRVQSTSTGVDKTATTGSMELAAKPTSSVETKPIDGIYTVQKGDSLGKLANRFKVTKNAIAVANPKIDMLNLPVGKKIKIP
jgi:LysM repeat protein